jgi:hypothetical protein
MSATLTDAERDSLAELVGALEFNGFSPYRPEALKLIALNCKVTDFSADDFGRIVGEYPERPNPRTLVSRLKCGAVSTQPEEVLGHEPPEQEQLRTWRMRLKALPKSYKNYLWEHIKTDAFFTEWFEREGIGPTLARKGLDYYPALKPMAVAMLFKWEIQDGRMTEELLETMLKEELDAKEVQ